MNLKINSFFWIFIILLPFGLEPVKAQNPTQKSGAQIFLLEKSLNFGDIIGDTLLTHTFVFRDIGDDTLRIYRLKSG